MLPAEQGNVNRSWLGGQTAFREGER